jgi:hypothetical protein
LFPVIVTVQVPEDIPAGQAPVVFQPVNTVPEGADSVSLTTVPDGKLAEQVLPLQWIPAGELVIVPCPVPASDTVSL